MALSTQACWPKKFGTELEAKGFKRSQAEPYVFRRVLRGNVVPITVEYADYLFVASTRKRDEKQVLRTWGNPCTTSDVT